MATKSTCRSVLVVIPIFAGPVITIPSPGAQLEHELLLEKSALELDELLEEDEELLLDDDELELDELLEEDEELLLEEDELIGRGIEGL